MSSSVVTITGILDNKSGNRVVDVVVVVVEVLLDLPIPNDATATFFSSANCLDSIGVGSLLKITPAKEILNKLKFEEKIRKDQ